MDTVTLSRTTKVAPKATTMSTQRASAVDSVGAGLKGVVVTWMDNSVDASRFWVVVGRGSMIGGRSLFSGGGICITRLLMSIVSPFWETIPDVGTNTDW